VIDISKWLVALLLRLEEADMSITLKVSVCCVSLLMVSATRFSAAKSGALTEAKAARCSYTLRPPSLSFTAIGGQAVVHVTTETYCTWTAESNRGWISITSPTSGSGEGSIMLTVAGNESSLSRSGTLRVGGEIVSVKQDGSCDIVFEREEKELHPTTN
jgi:hypothetical protein